MNISWGYNPSNPLPSLKYLGRDITVAKQVFSALLYRSGIAGVAIQISEIESSPNIEITIISDNEIFEVLTFRPSKPQAYQFKLKETVFSKTKMEIAVKVIGGVIALPTSEEGAGMGFYLKNGDYIPSYHLAVGLIYN